MGSFFSKKPPAIRYNDYIDIRFQQQTGGLKCPLKEEYRTMPGLESTFNTVEACKSGKSALIEKEKVKVPVERRQFDEFNVDYATNERNRQLAYEQAVQIAQDRAKTMANGANSRYRGGKKSRRSKSQKKRRSSRKSTKR